MKEADGGPISSSQVNKDFFENIVEKTEKLGELVGKNFKLLDILKIPEEYHGISNLILGYNLFRRLALASTNDLVPSLLEVKEQIDANTPKEGDPVLGNIMLAFHDLSSEPSVFKRSLLLRRVRFKPSEELLGKWAAKWQPRIAQAIG